MAHMHKRRKLAHVLADSDDEMPTNTPSTAIGAADTLFGLLTPTKTQFEQSQVKLLPKRLSLLHEMNNAVSSDSETSTGSDRPRQRSRKKKKCRDLTHVVMEGPGFPRSLYHGHTPPAPVYREYEAVTVLAKEFDALHAGDEEPPSFTVYALDDFSIYRTANLAHHGLEMACLEKLKQDRYPEFLVDGVLSCGHQKCYVKGVPFDILSIDGYGDPDVMDMTDQIFIQTFFGARQNDTWYKLGEPSSEYRRFYQPFLWLAQFAKHFVAYLQAHAKKGITLQHFRRKFHSWLLSQYPKDEGLVKWLADAPGSGVDYRTTVAAHFLFLWKECFNIDRTAGLCRHPVWEEIDHQRLTAIPEQPNQVKQTVVTPFAYGCFQKMYFGEKLQVQAVTDEVLLRSIRIRKHRLHVTPFCEKQLITSASYLTTPQGLFRETPEPITDIAIGDVVCVQPEAETRWRTTAEGHWLAYVQGVRIVNERTLLDVLWLYEPADTTLGKAQYPFGNELFLSDNCACGKEALDSACVLRKVQVSWFARDPYAQQGLFVRQKFRTIEENDTYDFVALKGSDFHCNCGNEVSIFGQCRAEYAVGDMVLTRDWHDELGDDRLQPMQVVRFDTVRRVVVVRRFLRKCEEEPNSGARPNELLATSDLCDKPPSKVIRRCNVRIFTSQQIATGDVLTPYDRDGTGDFYYLAGENGVPNANYQVQPQPYDNGNTDDSNEALPPISKGWDPMIVTRPKLVGMGIFCGGGNFDRGLEEGGAVKFRHAIDWAPHALHSYRANLVHPEKVKFFLGSVNDYLSQSMTGSSKCARPGELNLISAGSPCPGFSNMQMFKLSDQSKQNASMVASVVSFVDFFVPEYLILENVVTMTSGMGAQKDENVFAQIVAALVALGYQVQQFLMDAWSYGSSQQRTRVFIVASAPGLEPLPMMPHTHAHPSNDVKKRALGTSSNGLRFAVRREEYTPFLHVSPREATKDLPWIGDSLPQICTQFPDHRTANDETVVNKARMAAVPTRPYGMGLMQAKKKGLLRGDPLEHCIKFDEKLRGQQNSKMYARIYPDRLFPTLLTKVSIGDGINGRWVHWDENRSITVMEGRRAQGYLDEEVIIGDPGQQLKIVGNSVDRKPALVLGLALRESWMEHKVDRDVAKLEAVAEEPVTQEQPIAEQTVVQQRIVEQSIAEQPVVEQPVAQQAVVKQTVIPRPISQQPTAQQAVIRRAVIKQAVVIDLTSDDDENETPQINTLSTPASLENHTKPVAPSITNDDETSEDELASHSNIAMIRDMDNRTAKMKLNLSPSELKDVRGNHFKGIKRVLDAKKMSQPQFGSQTDTLG